MLASLLNNQTVVVGASAPPAAAGVIRREVGRLMILVNTAFDRPVDLVDADGEPVIGATLTVQLRKDGGNFVTITPTVTEEGNGAYALALTAAHNDTAGSHLLYITGTGGAAPLFVYDQVVADLEDDIGALILASGASLEDAITAAGGAGATPVAIANEVQTRTIAAVTTVGSVTAVNDKTGYRLSVTGVDDILRTTLPELYAADGATGTVSQLLYEIIALLGEKSIVGLTMTTKRRDGSSTAATYTLNSATTPTSITRAT